DRRLVAGAVAGQRHRRTGAGRRGRGAGGGGAVFHRGVGQDHAGGAAPRRALPLRHLRPPARAPGPSPAARKVGWCRRDRQPGRGVRPPPPTADPPRHPGPHRQPQPTRRPPRRRTRRPHPRTTHTTRPPTTPSRAHRGTSAVPRSAQGFGEVSMAWLRVATPSGVRPVGRLQRLTLVVDRGAVAQVDELRDDEVAAAVATVADEVLLDLDGELLDDAADDLRLLRRQEAPAAVGDLAQPLPDHLDRALGRDALLQLVEAPGDLARAELARRALT